LPPAAARPRDLDRFTTDDVVWIHGANAADLSPQEEQTMPLGMLALAAVAEPEVLEDVATTIREGVGDMAKAVLPESAAAPNYASLREWTVAQEAAEAERPAFQIQQQEQHAGLG
jgi:hypothetical protein